MKMYAVKNIKKGNYLNYASMRKKFFSKGRVGYTSSSPYPTLRPKSHIKKCFLKWIKATYNPEDYIIVEFSEKACLNPCQDETGRKD